MRLRAVGPMLLAASALLSRPAGAALFRGVVLASTVLFLSITTLASATCTTNSDCDDGNACTTNLCSGGNCVLGVVDCNDSNACTVDTCDPVTGCVHTLNCDDGIPCTEDHCGPAGDMSGEDTCLHTPQNALCDDGDACTTDTCTPSGCSHQQISCDDGDACTTDTCDAGICQHHPIDCDDGDACTLDACSDGQCTCEINPECAVQGCSPGYWKNNAQKRASNAWPGSYAPGMQVKDVFATPVCVGASLGNATLLQALGFSGSKTLTGTAQKLVRAAVAAVLNAASNCVQYPACLDDVVSATDAALASCDRDPMNTLRVQLEALNALGCPLDQRGICQNE